MTEMLRFNHGILQQTLLLLPIIFVSFQVVRTEAPLYKAVNGHKIPGQYIVVLEDDMDMDNYADAFDDMIHWDTPEGTIQREYRHTIKGFASRLSTDSVKKLRQSKMVKYIEENAIVSASSVASWGLDRVDQRDLPLDNTTTYLGDGTNTHIYVIDSGIRYSHDEFIGRTGVGFNAIDDGYNYDMDCGGHGTHCAGIAAGSTYGVASNATMHSVRVLDCLGFGSTQSFLAGMEWVFENATRPAVCSMSLGGPVSHAENDVVRKVVDTGIVVSVAGGNENTYACDSSPASAPEAITAGSTTIDDERSEFSNYGRCLDIFAPGSHILSAEHTADNTSVSFSGTSMACPHVSGAAAILLGLNNTLTAYDVNDMLVRSASVYKVKDAKPLSPNRLLYIGVDTCMTRCNSSMDVSRACQCDAECSDRDDCCEDYPNLCWNNEPTCVDRCGDYNNESYPCQCDEDCWSRMDCCHDYVTLCRPTNLPCNRTHTYLSGSLYSLYYPDNYLNDQTCRTLLVNNDQMEELYLTIRDFNLEDSTNCSHDSLTIFDGDDDNSPLIGTFCGTRYPLFIRANGPNMTLIFDTDSTVTSSGFRIDMEVQQEWNCSFSLTAPGNISSSNFPSNYNNSQICFTTLTASPGEHVAIEFSDFQVEWDYDFLYFFDGNVAANTALIGITTGNQSYFSPLKSSGEQLLLVFQSDTSFTEQGYQAEFISVKSCDVTLTSPGMVSSTNYPEHYYNNDVCTTRITADPGKQIRIIFSDFQLEGKVKVNDTRQCVNDFLQIYDASYAKSDQLIGTFCGDVVPKPIRSSGRELFLFFSSNFGISGMGYKAEVLFEDGYSVKGYSSRAFRGGFIGKIRVPVYGVANNWRIEVTFRRRIYGLELMECDAKLADIPDNGADKMHFILDAGKDDKKILHRGDKIEVEFIAKTFKRARDVKFKAFFKPNHFDIM